MGANIMKKGAGLNSPYKQFGCFFEKNIKKYRATQKAISFYCANDSGTSMHPLYKTQESYTYLYRNPDVKFEDPTPEEYVEWYFKKYGKEKAQ